MDQMGYIQLVSFAANSAKAPVQVGNGVVGVENCVNYPCPSVPYSIGQ